MKKRGVSPLIATVLLVGFVVALLVIVMLWGRGYIEEIKQKEGTVAEQKLSCATDIAIDITGINVIGNNLDISIENQREKIDAFTFRCTEESGNIKIVNLDSSLDAYSNNKFLIACLSTTKQVDVIPKLKIGKNIYEPCSAQHVIYDLSII
ncbi:MAG: archaellin/type IV pilin N-terminal domain-containing protein [Candidatus Woesearchaeota archaeon]